MAQHSERTRLLVEMDPPEYMFDSSLSRERKLRTRQFQCCLCALFLSFCLVILVISVIYSINETVPDENSTETPNASNIAIQTPVLVFLSHSLPLTDKKIKNKTLKNEELFKQAIEEGKMGLMEKDRIEKNIPSLLLRSPSYRHQLVTATSEKGRNLSRNGFVEEYATRHIHRNESNVTSVEIVCPKDSNIFGEHCEEKRIECNIFQKYRMFNGSCNNLMHPYNFGVAYTPFRRMLPPDYGDGISEPRKSRTGNALPSARTVSLVVHRPYYRDDPKFSVMLAIWGQFLDHDITATALSQKSNGSTISCCSFFSLTSPECFPVLLDKDDPFRKYNVSCMEFVRSAPAPTCCLGPREQMNQVTPFIDASAVYSIDDDFVRKLRTLHNGNMKVQITSQGRILLPVSLDLNDGCNREEEKSNGRYCFLAGDARANENLHLVSMHLLWVRQHNKIASYLHSINPHWDDEKIFQETRRIIAAQMQHITYNEFLPILFGKPLMEQLDLLPMKKGYFENYNGSIDPNIANCFATAAFRFAHSIIPGLMKLLANNTSTPEYVQMHKMLFNPFELYNYGSLDQTLRGAMNTSIEASDSYFTNELKSHMFEQSSEQLNQPSEQLNQPKLCGLDLVSLNVQRGRDHGLPGYIEWRRHCGLEKTENFDDLKEHMDPDSLHNIKAIYSAIEDIDLYTGALSEKPIKGSILGPTITCLLSDQFYRIKHGDRFWYETYEKPQAFTPEQLTELRKTTLANIICDNADELEVIQKKVMERVGRRNKYVNCTDLEKPNLDMWKELLYHLELFNENILHVTAKNSS